MDLFLALCLFFASPSSEEEDELEFEKEFGEEFEALPPNDDKC